eukprot:331843_1
MSMSFRNCSVIWLFILALVSSLNEYDTYNPECKRIRRPWHDLSPSQRDLYVSGLLELRNQDGLIELDELIAVASTHSTMYASLIHLSSSYLFWHNYLLWEIESRIRNL